MFGLVALGFAVLTSPRPDFSVDLFLLADNGHQIDGLDWLDKLVANETVEPLLRSTLAPYLRDHRPFVLLDAGELLPSENPGVHRFIRYAQRSYDGYDSMTESSLVKGVTKKRTIARTQSTLTVSGILISNPLGKEGYVGQYFMYFGKRSSDDAGRSSPSIALMDLNSYGAALSRRASQDKSWLDRLVLLSGDSVGESAAFLANRPFSGVCISKWGVPRSDMPNFVAFPPSGVIGHYRLSSSAGKLSIGLIDFARQRI